MQTRNAETNNGKHISRRFILGVWALATAGLIAGACGANGSEESAPTVEVGDAPTTTAPEVEADGGTEQRAEAPADAEDAPTPIDPAEYLAEASSIEGAPDDRSLPPTAPESPTGAYGYSRYVFSQIDGEVLPTLIEGPRGQQTRCQDLDKECSYLELKALAESDRPIPDYLAMTRPEVEQLVEQLDQVNAAVDASPTIEEACAAGFRIASSQNANMGIHAINPNGSTVEFDPGRPQMVLYAKDGGEQLTRADQGDCIDGEWTGETGYESVGAVFTLLLTDEHPEGFAGPTDNWHIHLNTCAGASTEGGSKSVEDLIEEAESGNRGTFSRKACEAANGAFQEIIPVWMMHAYVDPDHDPQGGVFAMFNPSISPVFDDLDQLEEVRTVRVEGAVAAPINNFDYGSVTAEVGERIVFSNSDSVPHTVTAGSAATPSTAFDSGVLGAGQAWEISFDEPGSYELFCVLHPAMSATVEVG